MCAASASSARLPEIRPPTTSATRNSRGQREDQLQGALGAGAVEVDAVRVAVAAGTVHAEHGSGAFNDRHAPGSGTAYEMPRGHRRDKGDWMSKRLGGRLVGFTAAAFAAFTITTGQAGAASSDSGALQMYEATVTGEQFAELQASGFDVVDPEPTLDGVAVDLVLSRGERAAVESRGIELELFRNEDGLTARQARRAQAAGGFTVWRDYDGTDGIRQYLYDFVADHREDREAGRDRDHAPGPRDHRGADHRVEPRPPPGRQAPPRRALARQARGPLPGHHARARVDLDRGHPAADGVLRRQLARPRKQAAHASASSGSSRWSTPTATSTRSTTSASGARTCATTTATAQITNLDGVDINRNYPEHWGYDDEGSNTEISSDTYRGPAPASEPETQAEHRAASSRIDSGDGGQLPLLRPAAALPGGLAGADPGARPPGLPRAHRQRREPRGRGLRPGRLRRALHDQRRVHRLGPPRARTCSPGPRSSRRAATAAASSSPTTRRWSSASSRSTCRSRSTSRARPPTRREPKSHLGNTHRAVLPRAGRAIDPTFANNPLADFRFERLLRRPAAGRGARPQQRFASVTLQLPDQRRAARTAPAPGRWDGGETFGEGYDTYYGDPARRRHAAPIRATRSRSGSRATTEARASARASGARGGHGGLRSDSFTYEAVSSRAPARWSSPPRTTPGSARRRRRRPELPRLLHRGARPPTGSRTTSTTSTRRAATAPDALGVLGHYDAVVWYTGDDMITREPGMVPGTASRLANDEMLEMRAYMNEGGNVLYTGKNAGVQYQDAYAVRPGRQRALRRRPGGHRALPAALRATSSSTTWARTCSTTAAGIDDDTGEPFPVHGLSAPFDGPRLDPERRRRRRQPGLRRTRS